MSSLGRFDGQDNIHIVAHHPTVAAHMVGAAVNAQCTRECSFLIGFLKRKRDLYRLCDILDGQVAFGYVAIAFFGDACAGEGKRRVAGHIKIFGFAQVIVAGIDACVDGFGLDYACKFTRAIDRIEQECGCKLGELSVNGNSGILNFKGNRRAGRIYFPLRCRRQANKQQAQK